MEKLWIPGKNGQLLAALRFSPVQQASFTVIICHGFRGRKENSNKIYGFASRLTELGVEVLAFDFQGSGESPGDFSTITLSSQAEDLCHVIDYVADQHDVPIVLLGRSFGGSTVLAAASGDDRIAACIFWSTPVHLYQTFASILGEQLAAVQSGKPARMHDEAGDFDLSADFLNDFSRHELNTYLEGLRDKAVLIIHGQEDEVVNPDNACYMQGRLPRAELHLVAGADHRFQQHTELRENITIQWLREKLGGSR